MGDPGERVVARRLRRDEDGIAMFSVVIIAAVASLFAVMTMTTVNGTMRRSLHDRQKEQALQLADAAASRAIGHVNANPSYSTVATAPTPITKSWVLTQAAAATVEQGREGEFAWIVPLNRSVVFGVGFVPSRAAAASTRVVQLDIQRATGASTFAFLAGSNVKFTGQTNLASGTSIHVNGDLDLGNNGTVDGVASATGTVSGGLAGVNKVSGAETVVIPQVDPRSYRSLTTHDLCPDGSVRVGGTTPCTGTLIQNASQPASWQGWSYQSSQTTWSLANNSPSSSVYVYQANADIPGLGTAAAPWVGNVVAEAQIVGSTKVNGDVLGGSGVFRAPDGGIAFVADRDLRFVGGATVYGNMFAGENFFFPGGGAIYGRIVAAGTTDTQGSPASDNQFTGGAYLVDSSSTQGQSVGVSVQTWREL